MDLYSNYLLEISWEVCRQIGGIYRVLRTKVPTIQNSFRDRYCLIGPDFKKQSDFEFEEQEPQGIYKDVLNDFINKGFRARFGKWLITGNPNVILIDYLANFHKIHEYKYFYWVDHGIETPDEMWVNDAILFGYQVVELIESFLNFIKDQNILTHFHEWNVGASIPIIRKRNLPVKIIFTTHATILGRYLAPNVENIYDYITRINPYDEAKKYNIMSQYLIERAAAYGAHVFTAVSDITAKECEHLLEKKVDFITPNGLNIEKFAATHEHQNLHGLYKAKIHQFVAGHFFPYYNFDLDHTLYIFTSGRYEFRNKGIDLLIDSLPILNHKLSENKIPITVVVFIITKASTIGYRYDVLQNQFTFDELFHACEKIAENIPQRILNEILYKPEQKFDSLVKETEKMYLKRIYYSWKKEGLPSVVTHEMTNHSDLILNHIYKNNLLNYPYLNVKIIYHPDFLSSFGSIIKLDYLDFIRGCHLGVFPSYYEPWGYTPMECTAAGIPSITTDYTGFSSFLKEQLPDYENYGLYILNRKYKSYWESAHQLADLMYRVVTMSRRERIELRNKVESVSEIFDWKNLIQFYLKSYEKALKHN